MTRRPYLSLPFCLLLTVATVHAEVRPAGTSSADAWRSLFPGGVSSTALVGQPAIFEVRNLKGETLGWHFRTDRVAPQVRGMRGEIGLLVGVDLQGRIAGVKVQSQREDAKWFNRIKDPFYAAFKGLAADGSGGKPDTVTGATVSSSAMVRDVMGSGQTLLALPAVKAKLQPAGTAPDAR